uniref:Distal membrane-arm assembly complex protein 2 n=1 Tax=Salvator merianae TaxID=96440 RepID=A0A8D0BI18_SALMN
MAAPTILRYSKSLVPLGCPSLRHSSSSPGTWKTRFLNYLRNRFSDVDALVDLTNMEDWKCRWKNRLFLKERLRYGNNFAVALYVQNLHGRIRFQGEREWYPESPKSRKNLNYILGHVNTPLEAVDVSGSCINYDGLDNLIFLSDLKTLDLSGCLSIDDWCLNRLHFFTDSLQELSVASCPLVTEKGLASLHHLVNLRHLDVSHLPNVRHKGLIRILLEEMLPQCQIVGMDYSDGVDLPQTSEGHTVEEELEMKKFPI